MTEQQKTVLNKALDTYGNRNQLMIAIEECNELATALLKFMRYNDEEKGVKKTYEKVLEERADVEVILYYIDKIYKFSNTDISKMVQAKIDRLNRWLSKSSDTEYSMNDRDIEYNTCSGCFFYEHFEEAAETGVCLSCKDGSN